VKALDLRIDEREEASAPATPDVRLVRLRKTYGDIVAVGGVDLEVARGEFFTLLGPSGSGKTTTPPVLSTALVGGALLAFALSFDEVIVTTFTAGAQRTLPIFVLDHIQRGQDLSLVNAVVFAVIVLTIIPVAISVRLTNDTGVFRRR
jgi:ABC-type uncharacterized transport system YnjBCD ATPase subunit